MRLCALEEVGPRKRSRRVVSTVETAIKLQVPETRSEEILKYLKLFGYKPERSILQVHVAGYFGRGVTTAREAAARERAAARYGGRTFTIVGKTHDPEILKLLVPPKKREASPGYMGYLFKKKDKEEKTPDELLPLDFTPAPLFYPREWKDMFGTRGYLITMHVPSDFASKKNELIRKLRRLRGQVDVKKEWSFVEELAEFGYESATSNEKEQESANK